MSAQPRPSVIPALSYRDPRRALEWLQAAFGFEVEMLIEDSSGAPVHTELRFGDGLIMVGSEWDASTKSPVSVGRMCTQTVHLHLDEDVDAHCARARAAGAEILMEPATQFYGDRTYRARDPEGHIWTFGQTVQPMTPAEWDAASGLKTTMRG
jgi:uncharacterized glyoxalase superfamily protein PhnB